MRIYLDTTIQELFDSGKISKRTYNCLNSVGMRTLEEVQSFANPPEELLALRNFGKKCYTEIIPLLEILRLEMTPEEVDVVQELFEKVDAITGIILQKTYKQLSIGNNELLQKFRIIYPTVMDLHYAIINDVELLLKIHDQFSLEEHKDIRRVVVHYIDESLSMMEVEKCVDSYVYPEYKKKRSELMRNIDKFQYVDILEYGLSPLVRDFIQSEYEILCQKKLSVRGKHFISKVAPHFEALVPLFEAPLIMYKQLCPQQSMMKTLGEVYNLNQQLRAEFDRYWQMSDDEVQVALLKRDYPYLSSVERSFVMEHSRAHGMPPMFFLLYNYMRLSEVRSNKIFSLLYGIFDGKERTLNELSEIMCLTRERVRQIASRKLEVHETDLIMTDAWKSYDELFALPFITAESAEYLMLKEREHLNFDFRVFARLLQLVEEYETEIVGDVAVSINRKAMPSIKLGSCIDSLRALVTSRYTNDTLIDISASLNEIRREEQAAARQLMAYVAKDGLRLEVNDEGKVLVHKNYIDVAEDLYIILAQKGEPMSIDELFEAFKQKYPDHKYTESGQIRTYLLRHPNIKPIGNTSRYGLDSWENVFFGTIRDLLAKLLEESDEPMHIEQLFEAVVEHYPNTKPQSLEWSMGDDALGRFVHFNDGYYGLRCKEYDDSYEEFNAERQRFRFDERFADFRKFVEEYNRYPVSNYGERESSLYRWMYNVQNGVLDITEAQKMQLENAMKMDEQEFIPRNATENEFRNNCQRYQDYINQHHALPAVSKEPELYSWMLRSKTNYNSYVDHRRKYLTDLFNYILSLGFSI